MNTILIAVLLLLVALVMTTRKSPMCGACSTGV